MSNAKIWKRAFLTLFLFFLFLFENSYADWKFQKIKSTDPKRSSYRLKFSETNPISSMNSLELELYFMEEQSENSISIIKSSNNQYITTEETFTSDCNYKIYLNASTLPFPSFENTNKTKIYLNYSDNPNTYETFAYRLRGNQRLLLDSETTKNLIKALFENQKVTIQAGRYRTTLLPDNFIKYCKT